MTTKLLNDYVTCCLGDDYDRIPKSVLAAIAVSFASLVQGEGTDCERLANARNVIRDEWEALYRAQIVPQKPAIARYARPEVGMNAAKAKGEA